MSGFISWSLSAGSAGGWRVYFERLRPPTPLAAALAVGGIALLAAWVWWTYRAQAVGTQRLRRVLTAARLAAAGLLAVALLGPVLHSEREAVERAAVFVLVDESQSMGLRDAYRTGAEESAAARLLAGSADARPQRIALANALKVRLAGELADRFRVETYAFASELRPSRASPEPAAGGQAAGRATTEENGSSGAFNRPAASAAGSGGVQTRLGSCLVDLLDQVAGQPVGGVFVLSDGCSNSGRPVANAAAEAAARGLPVYTVAVGSGAPPRDLAAVELVAPRLCLVGDLVNFVGRIDSPGLADVEVQASLTEDGKPVAGRPVRLTGQPQQVEIAFKPERGGSHEYALVLPLLGGEADQDNNRASAAVRVEESKVRVLLIAGEPSWEYRKLVDMLTRDRTIESSCYLQCADPTFPQEGTRPIERMPAGEADLADYDVVILCGADPNPVDFTADLVEAIRAFVDEHGGGLLFVAARSPSPYAFKAQRAEDILKMLPAELDMSADQSGFGKRLFNEPWRAAVAPDSADMPLLRLADEPADNERLWAEMPELYWAYPAVRLKPAATALLTRPVPAGEDGTLAAVQPYGAGQVALIATDNLWRWRQAANGEPYRRFWSQLVRQLAGASALGRSHTVRVELNRAVYRPGEQAQVTARVKRPEPGGSGRLVPLRAPSVRLEVGRLDSAGNATPAGSLTLSAVADQPGAFATTFSAGGPGRYELTMPDAPGATTQPTTAPESARPAALASFAVHLPAREAADLQADLPALKELADATGGAALTFAQLDELDRLVRDLPDRSLRRVQPFERDLWDSLAVLIAIVTLVGVEWTIRKYCGLL